MTNKEINLLHRDLYIKYGPEYVDLIATHASWVLLTPNHAYKIKKPVQYSFLDYSTIEKRKAVCEEELRLNQRLTTGMYLDVIPVKKVDEKYGANLERGEVIDYALKMKRMDPQKQMDILLAQNKVKVEDIQAIARQLAAFHQATRQLNGIVELAHMKELFNDIKAICSFLQQHLGEAAAATIRHSIELSDEFLEQHIDRLIEREEKGWVIDGHGDLHSRNIFLMQEPIIFDCIEFNEDFRVMDILNEIAFFCMDLHFFGRQDFAAHFLDTYLSLVPCMETIDDWMIFHYFKLYRANVRLKVHVLNAMQAEKEEELAELLIPVKEYFDLYLYYLRALG